MSLTSASMDRDLLLQEGVSNAEGKRYQQDERCDDDMAAPVRLDMAAPSFAP